MNHGTLIFEPVIDNPELVTPSIATLARQIHNPQICVAEIDPGYKGGEDLCSKYAIDPNMGANCVIVQSVRGDASEYVAIVVPVGYRADLNGCVKRYLGSRRVSLADLGGVIAQTGMEYGSITPFGLPNSWKILVDARLMQQKHIIIGAGKRSSKLSIPTEVLLEIGAEIIADLSTKAS